MNFSRRQRDGRSERQGGINVIHPNFGEFLLNFSVGQRITSGFIAAALIAALMIGAIGLQRVQGLEAQAEFYQDLVQTSNSLQNARNILVLMNIKAHTALIDAQSNISRETFEQDRDSVYNLATNYESILNSYQHDHLLHGHPVQIQLLTEAGHQAQADQQIYLLGSTFRTWQLYQAVQNQILQNTSRAKVFDAQVLERIQGERTFADALSALQGIVRFNQGLTFSVHDATTVQEHDQLLMTIAGVLLACVGIALAGLLIFNTFVQRLQQIRTVTQSFEQGNRNTRLSVKGRDEIAAVAGSVNVMLETMVADAIAHEQQRQLNQFKDQFIMNVSHELRTPLTQVYGFLELLIDYHGQLDSERQLTFLTRAKYGCQELIYLVNSVLDATRAGSDVAAPRMTNVQVLSIVHEVIDSLDPRQTNGYTFEIAVPDSISVMADSQYLRQILRNLVSNALKYSPRETVIHFAADLLEQFENEKQVVRVCVKDNGPGIPPEEIHNLFQRFVRLERDMSGTVRGTGLGLYVCKQLVEAMGGKIWIESTGIAGEGSRFCFTLPSSRSASIAPVENRSVKVVS
jgi:signal transduction histidine kinase